MKKGIAVVAVALGLCSTPAAADDKDKALSCQVVGATPVKADTPIYDRGSGGNAVAKLTGAKVELTIEHFPNPLRGRIKISTSHGEKNVRIEGWVDKSALRFFAARDLSAIGSNIWITKGQELSLTGASATGFKAEHKMLGSAGGAIKYSLPCDGVTLQLPTVDATEPPKQARTYQMQKDSIELFDKPAGDVIYTLNMEEGTRKVFLEHRDARGLLARHLARGCDHRCLGALSRW